MTKWTDSAGREWVLKLNPPEITRLRDASGLDVYRIVDGTFKFDDIDKTCKLVWASIESQAKESGLSRTDFEDQFDASFIEQFSEALATETIRFFPSAQRPLAEQIVPKMARLREQGKAALAQVTEAMIDEAIAKSISGNSSELSGATPNPSTAMSN